MLPVLDIAQSFCFLLCIALVFVWVCRTDRSLMIFVAIVGTCYTLIGALNLYLGPFVGYEGDWSGERTFEGLAAIANRVHEAGLLRVLNDVPIGRAFYGWLVGLAYLVFGPYVEIAVGLSLFFGVATLIATHRLGVVLWGSRPVAMKATIIVSVVPTIVVYSITPGREALTGWGITFGVLQFVRWLQSRRTVHATLMIAAMAFAAIMHTAIAVLLLVLLMAMAREAWRRIPGETAWSRRITTLVLAVASGFAVIRAEPLFIKIGGSVENLVALDVIQAVSTKDDSFRRTAYLPPQSVVVNGYLDVIRAMPQRIFLFLLTPFPQMVRTVQDLIGLLVVAFIAINIALMIRWFRILLQWRAFQYIYVLLAVFTTMFAWGTVNYGTGTRHKTKVVPVLGAAVLPLLVSRRHTQHCFAARQSTARSS